MITSITSKTATVTDKKKLSHFLGKDLKNAMLKELAAGFTPETVFPEVDAEGYFASPLEKNALANLATAMFNYAIRKFNEENPA